MTDHDYLRYCTFLRTQDHLHSIALDTLKSARKREELGISSLGVIMLVANYLASHGVPDAEFNPDWVPRLDDVAGILSVLREIDDQKARRSG